MRSEGHRSQWFKAGIVACGVCTVGANAAAATIEIVNVDDSGEGLNDPTPVSPVGGNPGATLGEQRLNVLEFAARVYEDRLDSDVVIRVEAGFPNLSCSGSGVLLGQGGAFDAFRNFAGGLPNIWYGSALADALAGKDVASGQPDILMQFNAALDNPTCLGDRGWYYGFDEENGNEPHLTRTVLHELGHGLGFQTYTNVISGAFFGNSADIYSVFTFDADADETWADMSASQRVASATNYLGVHWIGDNAAAATPSFASAGTPLALASSPPSAAPSRSFWVAVTDFAPTPGELAAEGLLTAAFDGFSDPDDGCETLLTPLTGRVALLDEGSCDPGLQVANAQDAGAVAVLIASTVSGASLDELQGSAVGTPTIPVGMIQKESADWLRTELLGGDVKIQLLEDPSVPLGASLDGFPQLYTPSDVAPGSSVSHWSTRFTPSMLMEPFADGGAPDEPDLTIPLLQDLGWSVLSGGGGTAGSAGAAGSADTGGGSAGTAGGGGGGSGGSAGSGGTAGNGGSAGAAAAGNDGGTPSGGGSAQPPPLASVASPPSGGCSVARGSGSGGQPRGSDLGLGVGVLGLLFLVRSKQRRERRRVASRSRDPKVATKRTERQLSAGAPESQSARAT